MSARWATYTVYVQAGEAEERLLDLNAELGDKIEIDYNGTESY